jgi:hypothetical protein
MGTPNRSLLAAVLAFTLAGSLAAQPLSGPYNVGPGGTFANIAAAISALSANGVSAPVTFTVTSNDVGPWTLMGFPGQGPANPVTFDGLGTTMLSGGQPLLTLSGCSDVIFDGFTAILTSAGFGISVGTGTTNCTFRNCSFTAPAVTSGSALFDLAGGSGCLIEDCTFGGSYEAFNIGVGNDSTTIQRCNITGGGWWIARIAGTNFTLQNNFITGNSNYGISAGVSGNTASGANLRILHNTIYIQHTGAGSQYCSLRWYSGAAMTEVQNNVFADIYPSGNTSFNMWCSGVLRPTVMNHNVFHLVNGAVPVFAGANLTLAGWQALGFDINSLEADPLLVAPTAATPDLRLSQGSPCATAGTSIPSVTTDFFSAPRTPPVDIGAHELTSGNLLSAVTSGGGVGDITLSLTSIIGSALEGYLLLTLDATGSVGGGPLLGIRPDNLTWSIFSFPSIPGSPFHFPIGLAGIFPDTPFSAPAGTLSNLSGIEMDAVVLLLGPTGFVGQSNVVRIAW